MNTPSHEDDVPQLPVYKSMKEDPMNTGARIVDFGDDISGYTMARIENGKVVEIGGDRSKVPGLLVGAPVQVVGDYIALRGLQPNERGEIIGFRMPFQEGSTDHIVCVKQGDNMAWLKPHQMKNVYFK